MSKASERLMAAVEEVNAFADGILTPDPFRERARAILQEAGVADVEGVLFKLTLAFIDTHNARYLPEPPTA